MTLPNTTSKRILRTTACLSFAAMLFVPGSSLLAGEITLISWFSGVGSVAGEFIFPLAAANNDDVPGQSPNFLLVTQKAYNAIGPVDLEFTVVPSGGTTEYFIEEGVDNGTGIYWSGYRLELGFGVGSAFVPSTSGDGLDFDFPDQNSGADFTTFFSTLTEIEDELIASGGIFPAGFFTTPPFFFSVDVPDGITSFTIRQQPIPVPEPVSFALLTMLGLGTVIHRRRN